MARAGEEILSNICSQFFRYDVRCLPLSSVVAQLFTPKDTEVVPTHQVVELGRPVSRFGEESLLRDVHYPFDACDIVGGHVIDGFPGTGCVRRNECLRIGRSTAGDLPCGISGYEINT